MDERELSSAIASFASMAGTNYILDPRVDSTAKVSIRWENLTVDQALAKLAEVEARLQRLDAEKKSIREHSQAVTEVSKHSD